MGRVEIKTTNGNNELWEPSGVKQEQHEGSFVRFRTISVTANREPKRQFCVYRFAVDESFSAAALVVVEHEQSPHELKVCLPHEDAPRIYRDYPLLSSAFLPVNLVIDGKFEPDQERGRVLMDDESKTLFEKAFASAVVAVQYGIRKKWKDAHWLAKATNLGKGSMPNRLEEKKWWTQQLHKFAQRLAGVSIVQCQPKFLPAIADARENAHFIAPRLLDLSDLNETTVERMWPLWLMQSLEFDPL